MNPASFLLSMGPIFGLGFAGLTTLAIWQFLHARELARAGLALQDAPLPTTPEAIEHRWRELGALKGAVSAAVTRASLTTASIPTLALLGTCLGFFFAIVGVGAMDLATTDPLAILSALMDGGISTALATTVCGQGLYLLLGMLWSSLLAGPIATAQAMIDEELALLRQGLTAALQEAA